MSARLEVLEQETTQAVFEFRMAVAVGVAFAGHDPKPGLLPDGGCKNPVRMLDRHQTVLFAVDQQDRASNKGNPILWGDVIEPGSDPPLHIPEGKGGQWVGANPSLPEQMSHRFLGMRKGPDRDDGADSRLLRCSQDGCRSANRQTQDADPARLRSVLLDDKADRGADVLGEFDHGGKAIGITGAVMAGVESEDVEAQRMEQADVRQDPLDVAAPAVDKDQNLGVARYGGWHPPAVQRFPVFGRKMNLVVVETPIGWCMCVRLALISKKEGETVGQGEDDECRNRNQPERDQVN